MNTFTIYGANLALSQLFAGTCYAALLDVSMQEIQAADYARQSVSFTDADGGAVLNTTDISFPIAASDWGDIAYIALYDSQAEGHCLSVSKVITQTIRQGNAYLVPKEYMMVRIPGALDYV